MNIKLIDFGLARSNPSVNSQDDIRKKTPTTKEEKKRLGKKLISEQESRSKRTRDLSPHI